MNSDFQKRKSIEAEWMTLVELCEEGEVALPVIQPTGLGFTILVANRKWSGADIEDAISRASVFMRGWIARMEYDQELQA